MALTLSASPTDVSMQREINKMCDGFFRGGVMAEREHAEKALHESRQLYRDLVENINDVIFSMDESGVFIYVSPVIQSMAGYSPDELLGGHITGFIFPEDAGVVRQFLESTLTGTREIAEFRMRSKAGKGLWIQVSARPVVRDGKPAGISGVIMDITQRRELEQQLVQSQKLEGLGTLAGGIAHDFNNILAIVLGHLTLVERNIFDPDQRSKSIDAMTTAVHRGAALVRQLLTFAHKAEPVFETFQVDEVVREIASLVKGTFPKLITVETHIETKMPDVTADRTQMHQVLLNLCLNARDAMSSREGTLTIAAQCVSGNHLRARFPQAEPRKYIEVSVADTGTGMDDATRERIFEPFFTTKEKGKGTGLGLSTVYGIVERHRGFVTVESEVGRGTTFHMLLPAQSHEKLSEGAKNSGL